MSSRGNKSDNISHSVEKIPNKNNTWESVKENRNRLLDSEDLPVLNSLEYSWELLEQDYNGSDLGEIINRNDDERTAASPLDAFLYYLDMGFIPPPEILMSLSNCFELYYSGKGEIGLEECFFGKRPKGRGNYAKRKSLEASYLCFYFYARLSFIGSHNKHEKRKSLPEIAEEFFLDINNQLGDYQPEIDIDSFLRSFRRWKG